MPQNSNASSDTGWLKAISDVADKDNVYLSDRGWVYRHYKNNARTEFWDEVIVAGEVPSTDSPAAFGAASPTFLTGDGTQGPLPDLTSVSIGGDLTAASTVAEAYTSTLVQTGVTDATYQWTSSDSSAVFSAATSANTNVTFSAADTFTLTCTVTSADAASTVSDTISVVVS